MKLRVAVLVVLFIAAGALETPADRVVNAAAVRPATLVPEPLLTITHIAKVGDVGNDVKLIQHALTNAGWPTVVDGVFGPQTRRSVLRAQAASGLPLTGVVDTATAAMLGLVYRPVSSTGTQSTTPPSLPPGQWRCPQHYAAAIAAGWTDAEWPRLDAIIWRESRCDPTAHALDHDDDSYGLTQLNMRAHRGWVGPLVDWDWARLLDPAVNLRVARMLWERAGWSPWR